VTDWPRAEKGAAGGGCGGGGRGVCVEGPEGKDGSGELKWNNRATGRLSLEETIRKFSRVSGFSHDRSEPDTWHSCTGWEPETLAAARTEVDRRAVLTSSLRCRTHGT
jgi:hypothetical protein